MLPLLALALSAVTHDVTIHARQSTPISPYIYGINFPKWGEIGKGYTLARLGGNRTSAYNWETNASNAGSDWHHQNDGYMGASNEPGWTYTTFLRDAQKQGAALLLTIPTTGYVAADKKGDGDVAKTPNYLNVRFHKSYAKKPGPFSFPPNTRDKAVYQDEFAAFLEKSRSKATPLWFSLDNEPDLWGHTHQRIWPKNPTYAQIIANNIEYAAALKRAVPASLIFGPANYGWQGFRTFQNAPDANGRDFLDVYLSAMHAAERKHGKRLLDVLDIHWYPEARGDGVRIAWGEDKPGTPAARVQAPRSLWDPTYVEDSWIAEVLGKKPIALLPGIFRQIQRQYPGTRLAITEYNYGGGNHISGALAQADVLGIFGRYGLFAACNWGLGPADRAQIAAFQAFRNFDGNGAAFGDRALRVSGERPADHSVYAALDSKNPKRLTVVAINKRLNAESLRLGFQGFQPTRARSFVITASSLPRASAGQVTLHEGRAELVMPSWSVTTVELTAR